MKTCLSRFIRDRYVLTDIRSTLILLILLLTISLPQIKAQCPLPELQCSTYIVSCADSAAQLTGDPGYLPPVIDGCGMTDLDLHSIVWPEEIDKCSGPYSHRLLRKWRIGNNPTILCTDTILVVQVNINSDSLICPSGRDTILCGSDSDPFDSIELRAPQYGIPTMDTFPLLPGGSGEFCGVFVNLSESEWTNCGNTKTVIRRWELHDLCGRDTFCLDTIVLIDTVPPMATFDPGLSMEDHTFTDFSGNYLTDTIGMSSSGCLGHGVIPYATVTDNCSDPADISVTVTSPDNGIHLQYQADEVKTLSVWNVSGEKAVFIYKYSDGCHRSGSDTVVIVVEDRTPAVAACHDAINLSLTNVDQFTFMKAASMDAESYDNCSIYEVLARRTDWQTACGYQAGVSTPIGDFYQQFADWVANDGGICQAEYEFGFTREVPFCCDDVGGAIMVEILVIDNNCNVDRCWGMVYVEDKIVPIVVEPLADVSITCNAYDLLYQSMFESSDTAAIQQAFGTYATDAASQQNWTLTDVDCTIEAKESSMMFPGGLVDDNCGSNFRERYTLPESGCVAGQIKREFIAVLSSHEGSSEHVFAIQWITVEKCPLSAMDIQLLLEDTTVYDCGIAYGLDGNVTIETPGPTLPTTLPDCSQYGIGFYDKVFTIVSGAACNKVLRTWCVVDWCTVDLSVGTDWASIAHLDGVQTFLQTIKIRDTLPPEITVLSMVADIQTVNCSGIFTSEIDATDDCGAEPFVEWFLRDGQGQIADQGIGSLASPANSLLPGAYTLLWRARDACNNTSEHLSNFTISSDAAPSVVAYSALTAVLTPMDTNNNGSTDIGMAEVWAKEFNSSSAPPCGGDSDNLIYLIQKGTAGPMTPVPPNTATALTFDCSEFVSNQTPVPVQFWVKDTVQNTADYANVLVMLEDNDGICSGGGSVPTVGVQGKIFTVANEEIADVKVTAFDQIKETLVTTTDAGLYQIKTVEGRPVMIEPTKDDDHSAGISTIDLLRVQRHILGQQTILDPYKQIAADANRDGKINPIDMIQLRKVLIGKIDRLPENTSWRFIDADYDFTKDVEPLKQEFPEYIEIGPVASKNSPDFIGVKIGDLNGNVMANSSARSNKETREFIVADMILPAGEKIDVPIYLDEAEQVYGVQLGITLAADRVKLMKVGSDQLNLTSEMIHQFQMDARAGLNLSWSSPDGTQIEAIQPVLTLHLEIQKESRLSDVIALNERQLSSALILDEDKRHGIRIVFGPETDREFVLFQNQPNPFTASTDITFELPEEGFVNLRIFDATGKLLYLEDATYPSGKNQLTLSQNQLAPGLLYYELQTPWGTQAKKMLMLE